MPIPTIISASDLKVGTRVMMRPAFGIGAPVEVTVTSTGGWKNGEPLFGYADDMRWAYVHQIDRIVEAEGE